MLQDLKNACRELLKNRWFTCITVLTLALGIGANTAIFGVVNKLLLNPLPYADSDRIFYPMLWSQRARSGFPPLNVVTKAWREQAQSFDGIESFSSRSVLAYDENGARVVSGMEISFGLPSLSMSSPVLGRAFTAADAETGAPPVVMLSYEAWQREYGGTNDVLGRALTLDEKPHVVVGVMPARWESFARGRHPDLWFPHRRRPRRLGFQTAETIARLRPGVDRDNRKASSMRLPRARGGASAADFRRRAGNDDAPRTAVGPYQRQHARCPARAARGRRSRAARRLLQRREPAARSQRIARPRARGALGARREHVAARARSRRRVPRACACGRRLPASSSAGSRCGSSCSCARTRCPRSPRCNSTQRCSRSRSACRRDGVAVRRRDRPCSCSPASSATL